MSEPTKHIHNGVLTYGGNRVGHSSDIDAHREGRIGQHVTEAALIIDRILDEDGGEQATERTHPTPYAVQFAQRFIRELSRRKATR